MTASRRPTSADSPPKPDPADVVLALDDLAGGYRDLTVFRGLELALTRNEFVGLTGPNGVGKTTLIKTIVGLLPPHAGTITLDGRQIGAVPAHKRVALGIGYVPEGRQIIGSLTVEDNLDLAACGRSREQRRDREGWDADKERLLDAFPRLRDRRAQLGGSLSGGEQQMLANARGLLTGPDVLMLDEPTQGLAPVIVQGIIHFLEGLRGSLTVLVVEQNREVLEGLADRIGVMTAGGIRWR